jgi:hypothetical protein
LGLPEAFSRKDELTINENLNPTNVAHEWWEKWKKVFLYHFDIGSNESLPDVKAYLPVDTCGKSEEAVAAGLKAWLVSRGRGQYSDGFLDFVRVLEKEYPSDDKHRAHRWIAVWFKNGALELTSHTGPWLHHDEVKVGK